MGRLRAISEQFSRSRLPTQVDRLQQVEAEEAVQMEVVVETPAQPLEEGEGGGGEEGGEAPRELVSS